MLHSGASRVLPSIRLQRYTRMPRKEVWECLQGIWGQSRWHIGLTLLSHGTASPELSRIKGRKIVFFVLLINSLNYKLFPIGVLHHTAMHSASPHFQLDFPRPKITQIHNVKALNWQQSQTVTDSPQGLSVKIESRRRFNVECITGFTFTVNNLCKIYKNFMT